MRALSGVLLLKILLTLVCWAAPLLLLSGDTLVALGFPLPQPMLFVRLLGVAYLALVFGYLHGAARAWRGDYPGGIVWMGLVSNGGACGLLAGAWWRGTWAGWGEQAQWLLQVSVAATGVLTLALLLTGPLRRPAVNPD